MILLAVCTGSPSPVAAKSGMTGHRKVAEPGAVAVGPLGLAGDSIVDTRHHGGPDQAVYLVGEVDRLWWQDALGRTLPPGWLGENLLIDGIATGTLCLGDRLQVGAVLLEITAPRTPCATFASVTGRADAINMFFDAARPGAYARVLQPGTVRAGDSVTRTPFPGARISLAENLAATRAGLRDAAFLARALTVPAHAELHRIARARLAKG